MMERGIWPMLRLVLLGSQRRSMPLVCSLVARCQGDRGSQKGTERPVCCSTEHHLLISLPWSQVSVFCRGLGTREKASQMAWAVWGER